LQVTTYLIGIAFVTLQEIAERMHKPQIAMGIVPALRPRHCMIDMGVTDTASLNTKAAILD
jgi:hypothetical protein